MREHGHFGKSREAIMGSYLEPVQKEKELEKHIGTILLYVEAPWSHLKHLKFKSNLKLNCILENH